MFCNRCGAENDDNAVRCAQCGADLRVGPPPMQGAGGPPRPGMPVGSVPNYLVHAILVTIFCCLPFGIVAIVYAAQVNSHLASGNVVAAQDASNKAKMWSWISFGIGMVFIVLYLGLMMVAGFAGGMQGMQGTGY